MMLAVTRAKAMGRTRFMPCRVRRTAKYRSSGTRPAESVRMYGAERMATGRVTPKRS